MARVIAVAAIVGYSTASDPRLGEGPVPRAFGAFLDEYQRTYATKAELAQRFAAFTNNYAFVQERNAQNLSYKLALNQFADLTNEEFRVSHLGFKTKAGVEDPWAGLPYLGLHNYSGEALDQDFDWVAKGAVTKVKNQGICGSCWAFSATGALEGASFVAGNGLTPASEQQLVDCSHNGNEGCDGGLPSNAFAFLMEHEVCSEESYGYTGKDGTCKPNCTAAIPMGDVAGFKRVHPRSEQALMSAVMQQPVSVGIEGDSLLFQLYQFGILSGWCGTTLNHGVLVTGFGTGSGKGSMPYWKVKNSWGAGWGEKGYLRIRRVGDGTGKCGIQLQATYPVVRKFKAVKAAPADSVVVV